MKRANLRPACLSRPFTPITPITLTPQTPRTSLPPLTTLRPLPSLIALIALIAATLTAAPAPADAQVLGTSLTYNTVQPCRIFDSRPSSGGTGPIGRGQVRTLNVVGSASADFTRQGGHPGGCSIPGFLDGRPQAQAVVVNFIAVAPDAPGDLRAWPSDQAPPDASVLNYSNGVPNLNIANSIVIPLRRDRQGDDISVAADSAGTHLIADVVGYFSKPLGVATVAATGGDYPDPLAAMNDLASWCPTPTAATPCLLHILPGVYDLGSGYLAMVSHVDIAGSGEGVTKITAAGRASRATATVVGAAAAELRALTVESTGGPRYATAIYNPSRLLHVTALSAGGTLGTDGIVSDTSPYPVEEMSYVTVRSTGRSITFSFLPSFLRVRHADVDSTIGVGISQVTIEESNVRAGIWIYEGPLEVISSNVNGIGGSPTNGIVKIHHSRIHGAIDPSSISFRIGASLVASVPSRTGNAVCAYVYDENFQPITCQ